MADDSKKGVLKRIWNTVTHPVITIPFGIFMGMGVMPAFADVGTWFPVAHDEENLRRIAFQNVMEPYTGWIPKHFGLDYGNPGFGTPIMDIFIGDELARLEAERDQRLAEDARRAEEQLSGRVETPLPETNPVEPLEDLTDPLADPDRLDSDFTGADALISSFSESASPDAGGDLLAMGDPLAGLGNVLEMVPLPI